MFIIIVLLFVFVPASNGDICNNSVILCYNYTYSGYGYSYANIDCTIYQNNAETISQAISSCSAGSFDTLVIFIDSLLNSTTTNISIALNLPNNIQTIYVDGSAILQPVYLTATQTNPYVSSIGLYDLRFYNSGIFYALFPNLTSFDLVYGYFDTDINFSSLKKLTSLSIFCYDQPERYGKITMDKEWVGGLSKLLFLGLNCGIQNITTDAFENLNSLTYLNLGQNNISELAPEVFRDLTALKSLYIYGNNHDITICKGGNNSNAFSPLKQLTYLYLRNTVIIPFDAFSTIASIQELYLPQISSVIVPSTLQHLHNLTYLSFYDIPLECKCSMQWASIVPNFGINIVGICSISGKDIKDYSLYTECELKESYQCFNKSISCDHSCINTQDNYRCYECEEGYGLSRTESCTDIDECSENPCDQKCSNTKGSYQCSCNSGYRILCDLISCTDIDECSLVESNSCGSHQCVNEQGSYRCVCDEGYQLAVNNTSCHDTDECLNGNNSCNPHTCLNQVGSYTCSCGDGYQLATNEKTCEDINECSLFESNSCGDHQCMNEQGSYRCVCFEGFQLSENNTSCQDTDECLDENNSCNQFKCLNLVGSYTCQCGEGYQIVTNGKMCEDRPTNASLPIQSANIAQSTGYSNGTFIGVISFFLIIILILILLLLTLLSIIIYMRSNKRNTTANPNCEHPNVSIQDNLVCNNQSAINEFIEASPSSPEPYYYSEALVEKVIYLEILPPQVEKAETNYKFEPQVEKAETNYNFEPQVEKAEPHYVYSEISPQRNMNSNVISNANDLKSLM